MNTVFISQDSRQEAQTFMTRIFALLLFAIWVVRLFQHLGLSQMGAPEETEVYADRVFWLLDYLGIIQAVLHFPPLSLGIDLLLLLLPLAMLRYPLLPILAWAYLPTISLYMIAYNAAATHYEHTLVGVIAISFLLCFKEGAIFSIVLQAIRYYASFIMASAALWKIFRGSLWNEGQMEAILKLQHSDLLIYSEPGLYSQWIHFLIANPTFATLLWCVATLVELVFIVGFFTKKIDTGLFLAFWLFILADFFVMGLHFWELGILSVLFLRRWTKFFD